MHGSPTLAARPASRSPDGTPRLACGRRAPREPAESTKRSRSRAAPDRSPSVCSRPSPRPRPPHSPRRPIRAERHAGWSPPSSLECNGPFDADHEARSVISPSRGDVALAGRSAKATVASRVATACRPQEATPSASTHRHARLQRLPLEPCAKASLSSSPTQCLPVARRRRPCGCARSSRSLRRRRRSLRPGSDRPR